VAFISGVGWEQGGGWNDSTRGAYPDWLEVNFGTARPINEIRVYTLQDNFKQPLEPTPEMKATTYGLLDFDVQYWDGAQWVTAASVTGNDRVMRTFALPQVTTSKVRVMVNNARVNFSRVVEVEAIGCSAP